MAKKPTTSKAAEKPVTKAAPKAAVKAKTTTTAIRNTAIPKVAAAAAPIAKPAITTEDIAKRAFEISCGPNCGSEVDNWCRAERELKSL